MKILIIHNQYKQPGGEDAVFESESNLLLSHGHEVDNLVYDNSVIETMYDKFISGLKAMYNPDTAHDLDIKIRDFKPDVIHAHNIFPLVSPSIFYVAKRRNIPLILTLHNYRLICPSAMLFYDGKIYENGISSILPMDAIWKGVYRGSRIQTAVVALVTAVHNVLGTWRNNIDCYITLTNFAKQKVLNSTLNIPESKLVVKPNFTIDYGQPLTPRENYFLFIGRLIEGKGIRVLLEAAKQHKFKLIIIGDGPLKEVVEDATLTTTNISYIGYQSKAKVIDYMKKCKALIFPSIWYEGFPVTIVEAFSTGTPVIASDIGSMGEIIQDGINGLHFIPDDVDDLISKIIQIEGSDEFCKKLSDNARMSYSRLYTPEQNYKQLVGIYKSVLEQKEYFNPSLPWFSLTQSKHW